MFESRLPDKRTAKAVLLVYGFEARVFLSRFARTIIATAVAIFESRLPDKRTAKAVLLV